MRAARRHYLTLLFGLTLVLAACLEAAPDAETEAAPATAQTQPLEFGGVGVSLTAHHGTVLVTAIEHGSPAFEAAVGLHDEIVAIDGVPLDGLDLSNVVELARGPVGQAVEYELRSGDGDTRRVVMERVAMALTPEAWRAELHRDRDFGGVGLGVGRATDDGLAITHVMDGLPAMAAGLREGERIVAVDGVELRGQPIEAYLSRIRGVPDSAVSLDLVDENGQLRQVELTRTSIVLPAGRHCRSR